MTLRIITDTAPPMQPDALDAVLGLPLAIVRRAADMLVLHFGKIRPHPSGDGTVGDYALHVQCAWRFEGPNGVVTGRDDLWEYAGPGERPSNWTYDDGLSLQDVRFSRHFVRDQATRSWVDESHRFVVTAVKLTGQGDIRLELTEGYVIAVFPAGSRGEAWRFFAPGGGGDHLVFPPVAGDFALSYREVAPASDWEAWLKLVKAPKAGAAMEAPPTVVMSPRGTRYRCGRCGTVLVIAEFGALKGFVIHCRRCDRYNEVTL